jgi:hypothetical protein
MCDSESRRLPCLYYLVTELGRSLVLATLLLGLWAVVWNKVINLIVAIPPVK